MDIFLNAFKVVNWQKIEKSFGLGSVKIFKGSAETEPWPKPLGSAETETESKGSVVHYQKAFRLLSDPVSFFLNFFKIKKHPNSNTHT